ncbi:MAG: hypothetical protein HF314_06620 [Ignavibacteria bacterium]|nr:hypothetical protein [Ignavibacteria bacterium]MCU7502729.1 hypothetical protein [Ignavibacteria bacterium]MCU7517342.1 hypothetical protein [Ignavibacteria bacterium]
MAKIRRGVFIVLGSILIVTGVIYLSADLTDRAALYAIPVILAGVAIIAIDVFMYSQRSTFRQKQRRKGAAI